MAIVTKQVMSAVPLWMLSHVALTPPSPHRPCSSNTHDTAEAPGQVQVQVIYKANQLILAQRFKPEHTQTHIR